MKGKQKQYHNLSFTPPSHSGPAGASLAQIVQETIWQGSWVMQSAGVILLGHRAGQSRIENGCGQGFGERRQITNNQPGLKSKFLSKAYESFTIKLLVAPSVLSPSPFATHPPNTPSSIMLNCLKFCIGATFSLWVSPPPGSICILGSPISLSQPYHHVSH